MWMIVALATFVAAAFAPLSFDEAFWLAITRQLDQGARLYSTAVDHKTPVWFALVRALDWIPGSFALARALLLAAIAAMIVRLLTRLGRRPADSGIVVAVALLASHLASTIELVAAALVLLVVVEYERRPLASIALSVLAVWLDVRLYALLGALALVAVFEHRQRRWAIGGTLLLLANGILLMSWGELRFGVIELAAASRSYIEWSPLRQLGVAVAILSPLTPLFAKDLLKEWWVLLAGGTLIALASLHPFSHYWIYAILAAGFVVVGSRKRRLLASGLMLAPLIVAGGLVVSDHGKERTYRFAAEQLAERLAPHETFIPFDVNPHLAAFLPGHTKLRSGNVMYAATATQRLDYFREDLMTSVEDADLIVAPAGQLRTPLHPPLLEDLRTRIAEELDSFDCEYRIGGLIVYDRDCD